MMQRSYGAIVGKIWRLGLSATAILPPRPTDLSPLFTTVSAAGLAILSIEPDQCRYPFGDPKGEDFRYCCAPCPIDREPRYCDLHHKMTAGRGA
jgi:hypothetical protein